MDLRRERSVPVSRIVRIVSQLAPPSAERVKIVSRRNARASCRAGSFDACVQRHGRRRVGEGLADRQSCGRHN
jgi:hypothetical protein